MAAHSHVELKKAKFSLLRVGGQAVGPGKTLFGVVARRCFVSPRLLFLMTGQILQRNTLAQAVGKRRNGHQLSNAGRQWRLNTSERVEEHAACDDVTPQVRPHKPSVVKVNSLHGGRTTFRVGKRLLGHICTYTIYIYIYQKIMYICTTLCLQNHL